MENNTALLITKSNNKSGWLSKAQFRSENRRWLSYSRKIAIRIIAAMDDKKELNQKKLAELADVSPQQISKILKGNENLTLKTIAKFSEILNTELISFPNYKYNMVEINVNFNDDMLFHLDLKYIVPQYILIDQIKNVTSNFIQNN